MVNIEMQSQPTMYFIGVSTSHSSIMRVFPLWMKELGRPEVQLVGVDLKLHDEPENYRKAVARIKYDPLCVGGLVTSHKISVIEAARELFDYLDPNAAMCGEVSAISKDGATLRGHAKDPISAGLSLDWLLGAGYFARNPADVLCLGAGGSTTAIVLHFVRKTDPADQPRRIVIVNRSAPRLEKLRGMVAGLNTNIRFDYHLNDRPELNDELLAGLPAGSMVINATGMGKDLPGSPVTANGLFPRNGIAWELNYRGELAFLHYALAQHQSRGLVVEDGWLYFLHGWTQVISEVLHVTIEGPVFDRLAAIASAICSPALARRIVPVR